MNPAQRNFGSSERYLPILAESMTGELFSYLRKLQQGTPDLTEAIAVAREADGLVLDPVECSQRIIDAVDCACLLWESMHRTSSDRANARERLEARQASIKSLRLLARQLEADTRIIAASGSDVAGSERQREELRDVVKSVNDASDAISKFLIGQRRLLRDKGGNRQSFERLFVRKMLSVWRDVTGKEPGKRRTPVIRFSAIVWEVFEFQPRRRRPVYPWLAQRFKERGKVDSF
jgi:hypothetical protein